MKNAYAIINLSMQLGKVSEMIQSLASGIQDCEQGNPDVVGAYEDMLLDEVNHTQVLTLELTRLLTEQEVDAGNHADEDGSAFAAGDLTDVKAGEIDKTGIAEAEQEEKE